METYVPDYYNDFHCTASACRHSCCIGWEIDIDRKTYRRYLKEKGPLKEKLQYSIFYDPRHPRQLPHFILQKNKRCPFLDSGNLCEIYQQMGKDSLCQICSDHPRFRNYWEDRIEVGLGMSCEEAARIILSQTRKTRLVLYCSDGPKQDISAEQKTLRELRDHLIVILQDRTVPMDERIGMMLEKCHIDHPLHFKGNIQNEVPLEQFAVYVLYRNFSDVVYDHRLVDRVFFVAKYYTKIRNTWAEKEDQDLSDLIELCRKFSTRVEYDTDTWGLE